MTTNQKERPGVMLYFDAVRPAISRLDETQCGALLRSLMDYAQYGVIPELDPMTGLAFDMLVPKIDRDAERYEETREQRQYAAYAREKKKTGESCLSFADWRLTRAGQSDHENIGPISPVNENNGPYPSASATTTISTFTSTFISLSATPLPSPAAAGEGKAKTPYRISGTRCFAIVRFFSRPCRCRRPLPPGSSGDPPAGTWFCWRRRPGGWRQSRRAGWRPCGRTAG